MQLVILHHHLNRGGVTSVVANHLRSLATLPEADRPERVVVFYDGQHDGWPNDLPSELSIALVEEPALAYDAPGAEADPEKLADTLSDRFDAAGVLPGDSLLHAHNHALGKNASLPRALEHLAGDGWRMLLQVHDFAEDNRPENYTHLQQAIGVPDPDELGQILYPQASSVHYATLTERDADILRAAGFADERLHTLPNPVADFGEMPSTDEAKARVFPALGLPPETRLVVYPVRGIRRKNLGEMLLLSALAPEGMCFAVTLAPKNPVELASFDRWRRLAESLGLPCRFDTGGSPEHGGYGCDFRDTLAAADAILTTSMAEGFGMVFLEAWLAGKPLVGRDLPEITREFKAVGMKFDGMWEELRAAGNVEADFGRLTPAEQVQLIRETKRVDPPLELGIATAAANVEANAAMVREVYSLERLGQRLNQVYGSIGPAGGLNGPAISGKSIVEHFADPSRQVPIRIEEVSEARPLTPAQVIFNLSQPLDPEPTDDEAVLTKLAGIRAVVFDVYGTLLVSGSGDISLASEGSRGAAALEALAAVGCRALNGDLFVESLHEAVRAAHAASGSEHPEVEIRDLWREVLDDHAQRMDDATLERFAVEYECRVNPIWPMPGLAETLDGLRSAGKKLGIVSNAQFFTPLAFEPLTGKSLQRWGFDDPAVNVWSYEHREAKPGTFLYEQCVEGLAAVGIGAGEALFVGNDLRNDVWPAQRVGFKTALFAGDARSLRWRRDDERLAAIVPDLVVTDLRQLIDCVD